MKYYKILLFLGLGLIMQYCKKETEPNPIVATDPTIPLVSPSLDPALKWGEMTLKTMTKLGGTTPTYGSRALGYMGLTMYETVVNGSKIHSSMALQMTDLPALPKPTPGVSTDYVIAMNAGQAFMLKKLFGYAKIERLNSIDSLENVILLENKASLTQVEIDRAVTYGKSVAQAIFEWSKTDGGYQGYTRNFVESYTFPSGDGKWVPPLNGQTESPYPLHPFWGQNRTFAPANSQLEVPAMMTFSKLPGSEYYEMYNAVYKKNLTLTQSEKEIAAWWGDDPTETFTPPGHSYSIANQIIKKEKPNIFKAAETYARVGTAVADAFINCWKCKYAYHCERPSSFVNRYIDSRWIQFWPEPPFPAFYSGHSVQGASSATVLEALYGTSYSFIDTSHEGRHRDDARNIDFKSRKYNSFWEAATESAVSRFYGGIHTKFDNDIGLVEGKKIGGNINSLKWNK